MYASNTGSAITRRDLHRHQGGLQAVWSHTLAAKASRKLVPACMHRPYDALILP